MFEGDDLVQGHAEDLVREETPVGLVEGFLRPEVAVPKGTFLVPDIDNTLVIPAHR